MTPEQWEKLKDIFGEALERAPAEREEFVRDAARDDPELLAELLRLLQESDRETEPLSRPAISLMKRSEPDEAPRFSPETVLARRFRVVRFIARGGMGEVYEAEDLELGERVALKAIRPRVAPDSVLLAMFRNEVQLAHRVTHPNVCRIFDLVQHEDPGGGAPVMLLSMELIDGRTLSDHLDEHGPMSFRDALPLIEEIAAGLQAVHDAGIIHGDLKPGNVMLASRPAGANESRPRAVVMDFGMAHRDGAEGPVTRGGTPDYYAPEQAQGAPLTTATDVYCFALIIAEMLGVPKPARLKPDAERMPSRWARLLRRCLDGDPSRRYARPSELAFALRRSADYSRRTAIRVAATLPLAAAVVWGALYLGNRGGIPRGTSSRLLFEEGDIYAVRAVSPDGRFLAMDTWENGIADLAIRDVDTGNVTRLTHNSSANPSKGPWSAIFSPDGRRIAYLWFADPTSELREIGVDGKGERTLYKQPGTFPFPLQWSPDGKRIAASLWRLDNTQRLALISAADGSADFPRVPAGAGGGKVIFGNDGNSLVYELRKNARGPAEIHAASFDGEDSVLVDGANNSIVGWTPDRKRLVFASDRRGSEELWAVAIAGRRVTGEPRAVVPDAVKWETFGIARTGSLFYRHNADRVDAYTAVVDLAAGQTISQPQPVMERLAAQSNFPGWSEDGEHLLVGTAGTLLIYGPRNNTRRTVTPDVAGMRRPLWVAHGTQIMAHGEKDGVAGLFRIDPASGATTLVMAEKELETPLAGAWSADGTVHFNRYRDQSRGIFRLNIKTGERRVIYTPPAGLDIGVENLALSPDGRTLAFQARNEKAGTLMLIPETGGEARPLFTAAKPDEFIIGAFTWTPDSRSILASRTRNNKRSELWLVPVDGSPPRKVDFPAIRITGLHLNRDGRTIAFVSETWRSDIWVLHNFLSDVH